METKRIIFHCFCIFIPLPVVAALPPREENFFSGNSLPLSTLRRAPNSG